jgi:hypothetical protein
MVFPMDPIPQGYRGDFNEYRGSSQARMAGDALIPSERPYGGSNYAYPGVEPYAAGQYSEGWGPAHPAHRGGASAGHDAGYGAASQGSGHHRPDAFGGQGPRSAHFGPPGFPAPGQNERTDSFRGGYPSGGPYPSGDRREISSWSETSSHASEPRLQRRNQPRNYQRADDRICDDICERIMRRPEIDAGEVEVKVDAGEVTLAGEVDSRHAKREIEAIAEEVAGVKDVANRIQVRKDATSASWT